MADIPDNMKSLLFGRGARWHAKTAIFLDFLGMAVLVVAIIASATNKKLGLETTHWFILVPTLWIWGLWAWLSGYHAAKEE